MRKFFSRQFLWSDTAVLVYLAFATLLIHFLTNGRYGYFRDEFYYMACGEHLAWGYVDQPPFAALMSYVTRHLLGDSLFALRFFPAVCGALIVLLTGLMTRELGGGRFAQRLAATAVIVGPAYLGINNFFSMNCFDHLFWGLAVLILIRILRGGSPTLWLLFGLVAGAGLMNKYSMGFLGFGLVVGLVVTPARKHLLDKWIWLGGILALLIFLPHILWEVHTGFPSLEFMRNATLRKNLPMSPVAFLLVETVNSHPFTLPLWSCGLFFYFFAREGKPYRALGWIFVTTLALLLLLKGKPYYLAPAYFMLFAAGALVLERFVQERGWNWLKPVYVAALVLGGLIIAPYVLPVLPVETFLRYQDFLGIKPPKEERGKPDKLPQQYADMFGWENMVASVARVYNSLSPEEKAKCVIGASNYGEAGAIDFFGKKYGLPHAISSHNNYWIWGPGEKPGEILIVVGGNSKQYHEMYEDVQQVATVNSEYARRSETDLPIYLCRRPKVTLQEVWPRLKDFI
jgi:hypothetical protein